MSADTTKKTIAPFAAKIDFKPGQLWQGKHPQWTFRSDIYSPFGATAFQQWKNLESLITKDLKGTYFLASFFDNRLGNYIPYGEEKVNNLVLQIYNDHIKIDKRKELDLSFLEPSFDKRFLQYMADDFASAKWAIDLQASQLSEYAQLYKQNNLCR